MPKALLTFLSRDGSGLVLPLALGFTALLLPSGDNGAWITIVRCLLPGVAVLMALGSLRYLGQRHAALRAHPPPGRRVDLGGYRVHVLAEGDAAGRPAVVWLPGGHTGAYALHHLHRVFREEGRSILVDRPGTGWSDVGPFPRTTAREAEEVPSALAAAGEAGPFVLVGHSFGGLLAADIALKNAGDGHEKPVGEGRDDGDPVRCPEAFCDCDPFAAGVYFFLRTADFDDREPSGGNLQFGFWIGDFRLQSSRT